MFPIRRCVLLSYQIVTLRHTTTTRGHDKNRMGGVHYNLNICERKETAAYKTAPVTLIIVFQLTTCLKSFGILISVKKHT